MFVTLILIALAVEGPYEVAGGLTALSATHGTVGGILLLIFPGILAFCMIASEFALLKRSSVVTLSICGIFKEVVTISVAGIIFHDKLTLINVSGLVVTIASIACYNYMKISAMRREARNNLEGGQNQNHNHRSTPSRHSVQRRRSTGSAEVGTASGRYQAIADADADFDGFGDTFSPVSDSVVRPERHSISVLGSGTNNGLNVVSAPVTSVGDHFHLGPSKSADPERNSRQEQRDSSHRSRSASSSSPSPPS
jgi:solute carrier family 35 protein C2